MEQFRPVLERLGDAVRVGREPCSRVHQRLFTVHSSLRLFRNELGANSPGEHVFTDQKRGRRLWRRPPFFTYEEVFARSVQTVFRSELECRTPNSEHNFPNLELTVFRANPAPPGPRPPSPPPPPRLALRRLRLPPLRRNRTNKTQINKTF